ncbi:alanine racemase [Paenibacillus ginsengarvi]|uniref:Alanine racemase n=1 Tax=Paenibacillus ginsengarvi TaxID=400777 RepID=A0A3B0CL53_9BACL|nr:alanine racemase [Paenibacillus ginsengarvi]RKN84979.1 alanine racemase [Paenibacillus ginsengarvi]
MDLTTNGAEPPHGYRHTWADISLEAITHNTKLFKSNLTGAAALMAVVKANGYGHGAVETAKAAIRAGADRLGVAIVDEALQLREAGITHPVLVLGYTPAESVSAAVENDVELTVFTDDVLEAVTSWAERLKQPARIHIKIDTGMNRIGVSDRDEALRLARKAAQSRFTVLEGIFTHFADADGEQPDYTQQQFESFLETIRFLESNGLRIPVKHCCNSAATMRYPHMHLDMVRVGIALYGLHPSDRTRLPQYPLSPAFSLKSKIAFLKYAAPGQPVGYGCAFVPKRHSLIATVPIGYADGLSRRISGAGYALVRGKRAPYAGRVCMDQLMLDVTDVPDVQPGDEAHLLGCSENECVSADDIASWLGTINYEVVCAVGSRVPRTYTEASSGPET